MVNHRLDTGTKWCMSSTLLTVQLFTFNIHLLTSQPSDQISRKLV